MKRKGSGIYLIREEKYSEDSLRDIWDHNQVTNFHITGGAETEDREKGEESYLKN